MVFSSSQIQLPDPNSPTIQQFQSEGSQVLQHAAEYVIADDQGLADAIDYAKQIAHKKKTIQLFFKPIKQGIDTLKNLVLRQEQGLLRPFEAADTKVRARITVYQVERNERLKVEARRQREADEQRAEEERLQRALDLEALAKTTGDPYYARASQAELEAPTQTVAVTQVKPEVKGVPLRDEVSVVVEELVALARAVAEGRIEAKALLPNMPFLRKEAEQRGEGFAIPGVRRVVTKDVTIR